MDILEMVLKLLAATALGGLIGLEREAHDRPAGLRTHILVCVGSALFALCSYEVAGNRFDPGRITAQIVTGVGFLGAGTIIQRGSAIRGLTTAASIWTVAAIGIAVAIGGEMLAVAAAASLVVFATLSLARHLENVLIRHEERYLTVNVQGGSERIGRVLAMLVEHRAQVYVLSSEAGPEDLRSLKLRLRVGRDFDQNALAADLAASEDVISYRWE